RAAHALAAAVVGAGRRRVGRQVDAAGGAPRLGVRLGVVEADGVAVHADEIRLAVLQPADHGVARSALVVGDAVAGLQAVSFLQRDRLGGCVDRAVRGGIERDAGLHRGSIGRGAGIGVVLRLYGEQAVGDDRAPVRDV